MASSFLSQIETITNVVAKLNPHRVLDIGKGFGKYGWLLHEYCGIPTDVRADPSKTLAQQSRLIIDAVESNPDYLWPHIPHLYTQVFVGRIENLYRDLKGYDTVMLLDVIEHLEAQPAREIVRHFIADGATVVISTPAEYFQQELYGSEDEHHVSYWGPADMAALAPLMEYQRVEPGRIFVLSAKPINIIGFGKSPLKSLKRIARKVLDELRS